MKVFMTILSVLAVFLGGAWILGPREPVDGPLRFDPAAMGPDLDAHLFARERAVPGITRGAQKHVLWNDPVTKAQTDIAIVYVHGFSATLQEIRPVPDQVAEALGANLFYTRLRGHGRDGAAMLEGTVPAWRDDLAEALEIGRRIGRRVIVIGSSTGSTLATLALFDERMNRDIAGIVHISPNFALRAEGSNYLTWPFARWFVPAFAGGERSFVPENSDHAKWWTFQYPTVATIPMAAAVKAANALPFEAAEVPALFIFSDSDTVVDHQKTRAVAGRWGGQVSLYPLEVGPRDDRSSHVIAGDILSPGMNDIVVERILEWVIERDLQNQSDDNEG